METPGTKTQPLFNDYEIAVYAKTERELIAKKDYQQLATLWSEKKKLMRFRIDRRAEE